MTARVLVLGQPSSLTTGLIKALSNGGNTCDLAWRGTRRGDGAWTRAAGSFLTVSRASAPSLSAFGEQLLELVAESGYDVVVPIGDWATWLIANHTNDLAVGHLTPGLASFGLANDKAATMAHAEQLGIATPKVWTWPGAPDPSAIPADIRFPVVVKARSGSGVARGLRFATNPEQLVRAYLEVESTTARVPTEDFSRPVITEFIPGFIHDACAVAKRGEVVNMVTQVRQLMTPIGGGVGAVNITTDEPELQQLARRLLESLGWNGPAQIEFKYDPRDGRYKLIEINPRLWGTLDLSIRAGMNFPAQIRDLALDRPVKRDQPYRVGLRYVFISRAAGAYVQLARTHGSKALRDNRTYPATTFGLDAHDPIPGAWEIIATLGKLGRGIGSYAVRRTRANRPAPQKAPDRARLPKALINTLDRTGDAGF